MSWNFEDFYEWANIHLGINLSAYKQRQLQRRINTVMENAGTLSLEQYSDLIETNADVREKFLDYLTINVTDFFRNPDLFTEFEKVMVEELVPRFGELKMWSAACSIGSEPYSLAMLAQKNNVQLQDKILATDIDTKVLEQGKAGIYREYDLKNMDETLRSKYFIQKEKQFHISPSIKHKVQFKKHDLLMDPFAKPFHVIVCRNVIIYFNKEVKEELYRKFSASLETGGILFTGATETIYKPEMYDLEKIGTFLYQKV